MQKTLTWRDSGNGVPLIQAINLAGALTGITRRPFIAEQLMEKASARTGLDDFGDSAFREGLDRVCREYSANRGLIGFGHLAGREFLVGTLAKRLQIVDWYKRHPDVANEVIERPWVITGMTRSGTTLSSMLFDLDARNRSPLTWEVDFPIPPTALADRYSDPRIAQCAAQMEKLDKLAPAMKVIHPWGTHFPQECVLMTQMGFQSIMFQIISPVPEYIEWYQHSDKRATYRLHKQMLQIWQSTIPTAYWSLKAPAHMDGIDALMETYPDARVIWSHRDPLVCVASHTSMALAFMRLHNPNIDPKRVAENYSRQWWIGVQKMMAYDKTRSDRSWCRHQYYNDLMKDPAATVGAAYRHFGDEFDPVHERSIKTWVGERPKNTFGRHAYSLEEFGLDAKKLRQQYAEYIETYNIPIEANG